MTMRVRVIIGLSLCGILGGVSALAVRPQAQDWEESSAPDVTEAELSLFIAVYSAMQADHDLTVETALGREAPGMTLEQFRQLERRIQRQERLVDRVRQALLDTAKARAAPVGPASAQARDKKQEP